MSYCYSPSELEMSSDIEMPNHSFTHQISLEEYIRRILILGSKNNKYSSKGAGLDNSTKTYIAEQIAGGNGQRILAVVRDIFRGDRAPKQDATFMIHAMLCKAENDLKLRQDALSFLKEYRTIAQLYAWKTFHSSEGKSKGFGRAVKRNLNEWILSTSPDELAYQFTKYMQRGDWGMVHFLKCAHTTTGTGDDRVFKEKDGTPKPIKHTNNKPATAMDLVLRYAIDGVGKMTELASKNNLLDAPSYVYLKAVDRCKNLKHLNDDPNQLALLLTTIQQFRLTREQVPTEALALLPVQLALLTNAEQTKVTMPMTALLRNLANMTRLGVFDSVPILSLVVAYLKNKEVITKAHIHPVNVLTAWFTYRKGHGRLSKHTWQPQQEIIKALEEMFYLSFKNVKPTGKRICFLIDCSGSMGSESLCEGVTNAEAAALLAMVFTRAEESSINRVNHSFYLFTSGTGGLMDVSDLIHAKASFDEVLQCVQRSDWGSTDISKGILQAMKFHRVYDGFVVITDNDVNSGINPAVALRKYRKALNITAKLAVVATQANDISIADPGDNGMMDFVGFDSHAPKLLQDFFIL